MASYRGARLAFSSCASWQMRQGARSTATQQSLQGDSVRFHFKRILSLFKEAYESKYPQLLQDFLDAVRYTGANNDKTSRDN